LVFDEIAAALERAHSHRRSSVEGVIGQFLQNQASQLALGHACLLLQALDGAEAHPVGALEFHILRVR
jgi:hypothetical protein